MKSLAEKSSIIQNPEQELAHMKKMMELNPKGADDFCNLGLALQKQGKADEAIKAYNSAIQLNTKDAYAFYNLGNALYAQGKIDEAIKTLSELK